MKTEQEIKEAAKLYAKETCKENYSFEELYQISDDWYNGYKQALSDQQAEPVDLEELKTKWLHYASSIKKLEYNSDNIINFFLPYLTLPAPESDAVELANNIYEFCGSGYGYNGTKDNAIAGIIKICKEFKQQKSKG